MEKVSKKKVSGVLVTMLLVLLLALSTALVYIGTKSAGETVTVEHPAPEVTAPFSSGDDDTYVPETDESPREMTISELWMPRSGFGEPQLGISIGSTGVFMPIIDVGLGDHNQMVVPESSHAGHYVEAADIGAAEGSTVIVGHVNFADASWAPMAPLSFVKKGAPVFVTDKDNNKFEYKVITSETILKQALPIELFEQTGSPRLVLITCGGAIEQDTNGVPIYSYNTVVTAELVTEL